MRLVRNVERIDEKVGLDYLFRNCLFLILSRAHG